MSFREKSAWFVLIGLLATFGVFFFSQAHGLMEPGMAEVHWFLMAVVGFILLQLMLHIIAAALDRKGAGTPPDERERIFALKAARNAGLALTIGVLAVPVSAHLSAHHAREIHVHYILFILMGVQVFSEVVRAASKIIYYRLGR